jgi:DNA-binding transcriptional regulator LsrR (DeoR family)
MHRAPQPDSDKRALLANVALLYYGEGLTQGDIARRMRVSRATVLNMLREARESGIVDIRVDGRSIATSTLGQTLREGFGLEDVYIAGAAGATGDRAQMLSLLGRIGAVALSEIVRPGDRLGVAWGETVRAVSRVMRGHDLPDIRVFQMIGSMISDRVPASELCTIEIATAFGAPCYTLHAPAIASSGELAALIRAEPTIERQLQELATLDTVIFSIGNVDRQTHVVRAGMVAPEHLAQAVRAGAAGIICSRFIDAAGRAVDEPPVDRVIGAALADFLNAERRLLVVGGADRADAALAALSGGYATHLCVDQTLALRLEAALGA